MASRPRSAPAAAEPEALRPPLQNRSRASLERVLEAGQKLLEEEGWEGFTVQEVSPPAKGSIGSVYARAPSNDALSMPVYDRALLDIVADQESLQDDSRWEGM